MLLNLQLVHKTQLTTNKQPTQHIRQDHCLKRRIRKNNLQETTLMGQWSFFKERDFVYIEKIGLLRGTFDSFKGHRAVRNADV